MAAKRPNFEPIFEAPVLLSRTLVTEALRDIVLVCSIAAFDDDTNVPIELKFDGKRVSMELSTPRSRAQSFMEAHPISTDPAAIEPAEPSRVPLNLSDFATALSVIRTGFVRLDLLSGVDGAPGAVLIEAVDDSFSYRAVLPKQMSK